MRRNERRALFGCSIDIGRNELPVPVELLRRVGLIVNLDFYPLPFLQTQQRPRKLSVVGRDGDDAIRRQLNGFRGDRERVVGWTIAP